MIVPQGTDEHAQRVARPRFLRKFEGFVINAAFLTNHIESEGIKQRLTAPDHLCRSLHGYGECEKALSLGGVETGEGRREKSSDPFSESGSPISNHWKHKRRMARGLPPPFVFAQNESDHPVTE
jgi:hypothetical protein